MKSEMNAAEKIAELCRNFYRLGWVSGTGGGLAIREGDTIVMAPSGVQKERLDPTEMFRVDLHGKIMERPSDPSLSLSACAPLFLHAFNKRNAGAVIHSHSIHAMLVTLMFEKTFEISELEMIKGIRGHGFFDTLRVPIIENTAHECDLADQLKEAIEANPASDAVLVRRHGVYVWGADWIEAKTQAESYDYLFEAAVRMQELKLQSGGTFG